MDELYLRTRLESLRALQNADGGWGYVPGKQSWIEPTVYAVLALDGQPDSQVSVDRAWSLLRSWQLPDGGWRPAASIEQANWATALAVTLHCVRSVYDEPFVRGVDWLVDTRGAEGGWLGRILYHLRPRQVDSDPSLQGWPWLPGTSSWVEPTSHALVALRRASRPLLAAGYPNQGGLRSRVRMGEKMLMQRRAKDGGWNCGNRIVLGEALPSYPETTGLALLGLMGCPNLEPTEAIAVARRQYRATRSPLARAWLASVLRNYGVSPSETGTGNNALQRYVHVTALEALAAPSGNYRLLGSEGIP